MRFNLFSRSNKPKKPKIRIFKNPNSMSARRYRPPGIRAFYRTIKKPENFGNKFEKGARVLQLHFDTVDSREMIQLVRLFTADVKKLKRKGFKGVFGDTPNSALIKKLQKNIRGITITNTPMAEEQQARETYQKMVEGHKYPEKYLTYPIKRIVISFK